MAHDNRHTIMLATTNCLQPQFIKGKNNNEKKTNTHYGIIDFYLCELINKDFPFHNEHVFKISPEN